MGRRSKHILYTTTQQTCTNYHYNPFPPPTREYGLQYFATSLPHRGFFYFKNLQESSVGSADRSDGRSARSSSTAGTSFLKTTLRAHSAPKPPSLPFSLVLKHTGLFSTRTRQSDLLPWGRLRLLQRSVLVTLSLVISLIHHISDLIVLRLCHLFLNFMMHSMSRKFGATGDKGPDTPGQRSSVGQFRAVGEYVALVFCRWH